MNERIAKMYRAHVALLTFGAWLSISNHCAVGALIASKDQSAMAPMHCHSEQPAPSKKSGAEEMPCCKVLRATFTVGTNIVHNSTKIFLPAPKWIVAELISANGAQFDRALLELDTGLPATESFAESVLQRSLLRSRSAFHSLTTRTRRGGFRQVVSGSFNPPPE